jgi:hypothetical protein
MVASHKTNFAVGISSGGITKARHGTYRACDNCGVTFVTGDTLLTVDGRQYLLHLSHGVGSDQLAGRLVTGPWGTAIELGEPPDDRVILESDDMPRDTGDDPLEHIKEIVAATRAREAS